MKLLAQDSMLMASTYINTVEQFKGIKKFTLFQLAKKKKLAIYKTYSIHLRQDKNHSGVHRKTL